MKTSTNKHIISFSTELEKFYYSSVLLLDDNLHNGDYLNMYMFIAKDASSNNDVDIKEIEKTDLYLKNVHKNLIFMKKLILNDINVVAERIDWKANTFYYAYSDKDNMGEKYSDGKLVRKFYVRNRFDQVFKCLWNNINTSDTIEISNIQNNEYYYTIEHSGGTFEVGSYVTIQKTDPEIYDGTYIVIQSSEGIANVSYENGEQYVFNTTSEYVSGGSIKYSVLTEEEPYFSVGSFDQNLSIRTSDGYKWKYLYTLDKGQKLKSFDSNWIPVPVLANRPNPSTSDEGWGCIETINIVSGGSGYENGTNTVSIIISGDGTGASAEAFVANNQIQEIYMVDRGKDYISANVSVVPSTGLSGSGAEVELSISPIGGHGFNYIKELHCSNIIVSSLFDKSENSKLPTDFEFNQIGLIYNPYVLTDLVNHANTNYISCFSEILVFFGENSFVPGETIYQGMSVSEAEYSATVLSFDSANNSIKVINTSGTPQENYLIVGENSGTARVIAGINTPTYVPNSGDIFYIENKGVVERSPFGSEQIRILINFS